MSSSREEPSSSDAVSLFHAASVVTLQSALEALDSMPVRLDLDMSAPGIDIALQMPHALAATGIKTPPAGYETARQELITSVSYKHAAGIAAFHQRRPEDNSPGTLDEEGDAGPSQKELHRPPEALVLAALIRTSSFSDQLFRKPALLLRFVNAHDPRALELLALETSCSVVLLEQLATAGCAINDVIAAAHAALGHHVNAPTVKGVPASAPDRKH